MFISSNLLPCCGSGTLPGQKAGQWDWTFISAILNGCACQSPWYSVRRTRLNLAMQIQSLNNCHDPSTTLSRHLLKFSTSLLYPHFFLPKTPRFDSILTILALNLFPRFFLGNNYRQDFSMASKDFPNLLSPPSAQHTKNSDDSNLSIRERLLGNIRSLHSEYGIG